MEKVSMNQPARQPTVVPRVAASSVSGGVTGGSQNVDGRSSRFLGLPASSAFSDLLSGIDFGGSTTSTANDGSVLGDLPSSGLSDGLSSPDDYRAFLDAGGQDKSALQPNVVPLFAAVVNARQQPVTSSPEAGHEELSTHVAPDEASVESFTIAHPAWGVLDVDSRRQGASWEVVVRCGDSDTRQRLKSREGEFRDLLKREFGVTLELDVQPASKS
jgi:hypothetical protein